jgi:hypothetical protein
MSKIVIAILSGSLKIRNYSIHDERLRQELKRFLKLSLKMKSRAFLKCLIKTRLNVSKEIIIDMYVQTFEETVISRTVRNVLPFREQDLPLKLDPYFCCYFHNDFAVGDPTTAFIDYANISIIRMPQPIPVANPIYREITYLKTYLTDWKISKIVASRYTLEEVRVPRPVVSLPRPAYASAQAQAQAQAQAPSPSKKISICLEEKPTGDCVDDDELLCSICLANKPFIYTKCKHAFCSCILSYTLEYNKFACPYCRETLKELNVHDVQSYETMKSLKTFLPKFVEIV